MFVFFDCLHRALSIIKKKQGRKAHWDDAVSKEPIKTQENIQVQDISRAWSQSAEEPGSSLVAGLWASANKLAFSSDSLSITDNGMKRQ